MCGRYTLIKIASDLFGPYKVKGDFDWKPHYNITPSLLVPVLIDGEDGLECRLMKWGLIPHWAKDEKIARSTINARAETVAEKPAFRDSFKKRRCVIPASGFYEWKATGDKKKQPYYFAPGDGMFSFCGLWSTWKAPDGTDLETCAIITTTANDVVAPVHDRMPVAITNNMMGAWLSSATKPEELQSFLAPFPASKMTARTVTKPGAEAIEALKLEKSA